MKRKTILLITSIHLLICVFFLTSCSLVNSRPKSDYDPNIPYLYNDNTLYVSAVNDRAKSFNTFTELDQQAEDVFTGKCISSTAVFQNDWLYTRSEIEIIKVYKGNLKKGDIISVIEYGGITSYEDYCIGVGIEDKDFINEDTSSIPDDMVVAQGTDGHFPIKPDQEVLLFAKNMNGFLKDYDGPLYEIINSYDGKFYKQADGSYARSLSSNTDKLVFTEKSLKVTKKTLKEAYS